MKRVIVALALLLTTATARAQPSAWLSISRSELQRGQSYTAVATVATPHTSVALQLPPGMTATGPNAGTDGMTYAWRLTVAEDAPLSRAPVVIGLLVEGRQVDRVNVRIWTDAVRNQKIFLPLLEKE